MRCETCGTVLEVEGGIYPPERWQNGVLEENPAGEPEGEPEPQPETEPYLQAGLYRRRWW